MTSSVSMPVLPKHAGQDVKDVIYACISTDAKNRPDAEQIFMKSLDNLEEEDRALASVETSYTMSEIGPPGSDLQSPDPSSKSMPVRATSSSAQADKPSPGSKLTPASTQPQAQVGAEAPIVSHSVQPAYNAVPRRAADSFFKLDSASVLSEPAPISGSSAQPKISKPIDKTEKKSTWARLKSSFGGNRDGKASMATKSRHVKASSLSESFQTMPKSETRNGPERLTPSTNFGSAYSSSISGSVSMDFGRGNSDEEIGALIGSLAVDYYRYPPLEMFNRFEHISKKVFAIHLGEDMKFSHSNIDAKQPGKGFLGDRFLSASSKASYSRAEVSVEVELDRAREFQLEDYEEYFAHIMDSAAPRDWVRRKKQQNRRVVLVVGYIVYTNTRVHEAGGRNGSGRNSASASGQFIDVKVSAGTSISGEVSTGE